MSHRITRKLEIDAGHRLMNHEGKCRNYHGHRYVFEISCEAPALDACGRVVDFSVVKSLVGRWLEVNLDHAMILERGDPLYAAFLEEKCHVYVMDEPPTAENIAKLVGQVSMALFESEPFRLYSVKCYETPNCWAYWRPKQCLNL